MDILGKKIRKPNYIKTLALENLLNTPHASLQAITLQI